MIQALDRIQEKGLVFWGVGSCLNNNSSVDNKKQLVIPLKGCLPTIEVFQVPSVYCQEYDE